MNKLKIYWETDKISIAEPSGKIHHSDINLVDGVNLIDLMFLKKYIGQEVEMYMTNRGPVPEITRLTDVGIQSCGVHYFEVQ